MLIESKFGGADHVRVGPPFVATQAAEVSGQALKLAPSLPEVVPPNARPERGKSLLWLALAGIFGAALALAGTAAVMRQATRYPALVPPATLQEPASQQQATIAEQAQAPLYSAASVASTPPEIRSSAKSGAELENRGPETSSPAATGAAQAAILIASDNPRSPSVHLGSTVWSTIPPTPLRPSTIAVKADADIPDLKIHATMILRKNTDPSLQVTHTIDLMFSFADGALITKVKEVRLKMRNLGLAASDAVEAVSVRINDGYFLLGLTKDDVGRNLDLISTRTWFDFSLQLNDNRLAKLLFEKSTMSDAMLANAFEAWK